MADRDDQMKYRMSRMMVSISHEREAGLAVCAALRAAEPGFQQNILAEAMSKKSYFIWERTLRLMRRLAIDFDGGKPIGTNAVQLLFAQLSSDTYDRRALINAEFSDHVYRVQQNHKNFKQAMFAIPNPFMIRENFEIIANLIIPDLFDRVGDLARSTGSKFTTPYIEKQVDLLQIASPERILRLS